MAANVLFEVDASQLLAKLHLAASNAVQRECKNTNGFVVNTGIENDNPNGNPENPGKVKFNLGSQQYQVGFVVPIEYYREYGLDSLMADFEELRSKIYGNDSRIVDAADSKSKEHQQYEEAVAKLQNVMTRHGETLEKEKLQDDEYMKELKQTLANTVKDDDKDYKDAIENYKKIAVDVLRDYMLTFVGKDNLTKNVDDSTIAAVVVSSKVKDSNSPGLVSDFKIQKISDQERAKDIASFKMSLEKAGADDKKSNCRENMCFFVEYGLDVKVDK